MNKKEKLAVFDIDGTIFRKNLAFELINELSWMGIFPKNVRSELTKMYSKWLKHEGTYDEYRLALITLYSKHIQGCSREEVIRASQELVPFHEKKTYIFAENLISKLREESYAIIAVSGSPSEVVEEYNRRHLKFDQVFGTVYEVDGKGVYTGKELFEPTNNKGDVVRQYAFENNIKMKESYGVGDTESDISFLEIVENPIAFNPNLNLKNVSEDKGWKIVVEKKDVVYEIN